MKKLYEFNIPDLPPSLNSVYKIGRGKMYKSDDVLVFEKIFAYTAPKLPAPIEEEVSLSLTFTFADRRKYKMSDIDNLCKVMLDTLQKFGVIKNDRLIVELNVKKEAGQKDSTVGLLYSKSPL